MKRLTIIAGAFLLGVAVMLGVLQPWKRLPRLLGKAEQTEVVVTVPAGMVDPLDQAEHVIETGDPAAARGALQAHLKTNPNSARAHALLALVEIRSADPKAAQEQLAKAAALDAELPEVALYQGHLEMLLGDRSAARRSYTEALKRRPGDAKALAGRAAARFELGEHAGAVEDATAAISKEPDALFTRAAAYSELGRQEESVRDWTAYLARKPKDAHAWMNRGNAHERLGRTSAAVADWQQAVKLDSRLSDQLEPLINR